MKARTVAAVTVVLMTILLQSACQPPPPAGLDCNAAMSKVWPPALQARARTIIWRESRNLPGAQNRRSSAAGCFQLLSLHAGRFAKLGYSWQDRYNPTANVAVAYDLFREQGWSPWR